MAEQSGTQHDQGLNLRRKHICSLTDSQMLVLNLEEIQSMNNFTYDIVVTQEDDNKIYAYQYDDQHDSYLIMVPMHLYNSTKYKCKSFVQMLCLCSQTITIPVINPYLHNFTDLLNTFNLNFRYKMGNSVYKIYLQGQCFLSYLDIVTFHAVHYKNTNSKELIGMKKENGYNYCLNHFREKLLTRIFDCPENNVQKILEESIKKIQETYDKLVSLQRFSTLYESLQIKSHKFSQLQSQMKDLILSKHIPTIADSQYEQIINEQLNILINEQISKYYMKLKIVEGNDQKLYYMIILENVFQKMKKYHLEINVEKFLFVSGKLIQMILEVKKGERKENQHVFQVLVKNYESKEKEVTVLKEEIQKLNNKHNLTLSRLNQISMIQEEKEKESKSKQNTPLRDSRKYKKEFMTIQDLKEPLQIIPNNFSPEKLNKTLKNKKKSKQKLKKKDIQVKSSLKNLRKF